MSDIVDRLRGYAEVVISGRGSVDASHYHLCMAIEIIDEMRTALERIADGPWPDDMDTPLKQAVWDESVARRALETLVAISSPSTNSNTR